MAIIPVRVPFDTKPVLATEGLKVIELDRDHPLFPEPCPVCEVELGFMPIVLIFAGIELTSRKDHGWCTGAAIAVHAQCAGYQEPANPDNLKGDGLPLMSKDVRNG